MSRCDSFFQSAPHAVRPLPLAHERCPSTGLPICFCKQNGVFGSLKAAVLHRLEKTRVAALTARSDDNHVALFSARSRRLRRLRLQVHRTRQIISAIRTAVGAQKHSLGDGARQGSFEQAAGALTSCEVSEKISVVGGTPRTLLNGGVLKKLPGNHETCLDFSAPSQLMRGHALSSLEGLGSAATTSEDGVTAHQTPLVADSLPRRAEGIREVNRKFLQRRCLTLHARGAAKASRAASSILDTRRLTVQAEKERRTTRRKALQGGTVKVAVLPGRFRGAESDDFQHFLDIKTVELILQQGCFDVDLVQRAANLMSEMWLYQRLTECLIGSKRHQTDFRLSDPIHDLTSSKGGWQFPNDIESAPLPFRGNGRDVAKIFYRGLEGCLMRGKDDRCPFGAKAGKNCDARSVEFELSSGSFMRRRMRRRAKASRSTATLACNLKYLQKAVEEGFFPSLFKVISRFIRNSILFERDYKRLRKRVVLLTALQRQLREKRAEKAEVSGVDPEKSSKSYQTDLMTKARPSGISFSAPTSSDRLPDVKEFQNKTSEREAGLADEASVIGDVAQQRLLETLGVSPLFEGEEDDPAEGRSELWCHYRHCRKDTDRKELLLCIKCRRAFHASCCDPPLNYEMVTRFPWQCTECKTCQLCGSNKNEDTMLICDACDRAYHMECMQPPVGKIPEGDWFCPACGHCQCCGRELNDAEALDSSCFYNNQHRICPECKKTFSDFIASQGLSTSTRPPSHLCQESQVISKRAKNRAQEISPDLPRRSSDVDASKHLGLVAKSLCAVCIKPLVAVPSDSQAGGRDKLNASVICEECKQGAHVRCCESVVKRQKISGSGASSGPTAIVCNTCVRLRSDFCLS